MQLKVCRTVGVAAGLAVTMCGIGAAQRLSLAPQIGFYIPTENLYELASGSSFHQLEAGPSFGARLGIWFGSRFGIEASGAYVPTTFKLTQGTQQIASEDARLFNGSGQVILFLLPRTGLLSLYLSGGVGVVSRGGVAFTNEADNTDIAGVAGAGAGINLGPLALTVGADLFSYSAKYVGTTQISESLKQRDIQLKLGLAYHSGEDCRADSPSTSKLSDL